MLHCTSILYMSYCTGYRMDEGGFTLSSTLLKPTSILLKRYPELFPRECEVDNSFSVSVGVKNVRICRDICMPSWD